MPETIEDVEREIAEVKEDIAAIKAIPAENRSKDDKDLLLTYTRLLLKLRMEFSPCEVSIEAWCSSTASPCHLCYGFRLGWP